VNRAAAMMALRAVQEARRGPGEPRPIAIAGARELVPLLAKELREGGDATAVCEGFAPGAAVLVWLGEPDEAVLRSAARERMPIVGVNEGERLPYVLDTNLVTVGPASGLPVAAISAAIARALGIPAVGLAARLPVLRGAVVDELTRLAARRNAMIGAAVWLPAVDLPLLTINQLRLVSGIAAAGGRPFGVELWPEIVGVTGAAYGFRQLARLLDRLPVPSPLVRGGVAFAGTLAVGAAARRRLG
jgi:hypothetical protein